MQIRDRHILITGGAKRIGRRLAEFFVDCGARVTVHHRNSAREANAFVAWAKARNAPAHAVRADLTDTVSIGTAVAEAMHALGPVDILINSASDFYPTPTEAIDDAAWDKLLNTNLRGQFFFAQKCLPGMLAAGAGVILNIADVHGSRPIRNYMPYSVAKAGLIMMTKNLAREWAPKVRVNAISPGPVLLPETYSETQKQTSIQRTLMQRIGSPDDVVHAAQFLITNDYVTGLDLKVDGGRHLV